jgi:DNA-binding NarL/FixJ family response regulator
MTDRGERGYADRHSVKDRPPREETLRLLLVDSHELFRDCLASVLGQDRRFEVVAKVASGREALDRLAEARVDVLLVALDSFADGIRSLMQEIAERSPKSKVVLLGHDGAEERILECLEAGASGYLVRDQSLAELRAAIEAVWRGDTVCTPRVANSLFARLARLGRERRRRDRLEYLTLTPRELEILRLVAEDLSNQEIARQLFLSVHTVKNHIHKILETLGVHSRFEAVRYAIERGWLRDRRRR